MRATAPGDLGLLQDFINSGNLEAAAWLDPEVAAGIRLRVSEGDPRATIAREFGVSQALVSALARGVAMYDDLQPAESAAAWLASRGLLPEGEALTDDEVAGLIEFRELLRSLAVANTHESDEDITSEPLSLIARRVPLVLSFGPGGVALQPAGSGPEGAVGRLLIILFEAMRDGSWLRMKRCPGNGCPFTFYDSSRNRTGTWCSMAVCGNRAKVRSYQQRKRAVARHS